MTAYGFLHPEGLQAKFDIRSEGDRSTLRVLEPRTDSHIYTSELNNLEFELDHVLDNRVEIWGAAGRHPVRWMLATVDYSDEEQYIVGWFDPENARYWCFLSTPIPSTPFYAVPGFVLNRFTTPQIEYTDIYQKWLARIEVLTWEPKPIPLGLVVGTGLYLTRDTPPSISGYVEMIDWFTGKICRVDGSSGQIRHQDDMPAPIPGNITRFDFESRYWNLDTAARFLREPRDFLEGKSFWEVCEIHRWRNQPYDAGGGYILALAQEEYRAATFGVIGEIFHGPSSRISPYVGLNLRTSPWEQDNVELGGRIRKKRMAENIEIHEGDGIWRWAVFQTPFDRKLYGRDVHKYYGRGRKYKDGTGTTRSEAVYLAEQAYYEMERKLFGPPAGW